MPWRLRTCWKCCPLVKRNWIKRCASLLLALVLGVCSFFLVWEQLTKFLEGSTTTTVEKVKHEYLPLPLMVLCSNQRYKLDALRSVGLPENFLDSHRMKDLPVQFPDLNYTWHMATWSPDDFNLYWQYYEGIEVLKQHSLCLIYSNKTLAFTNKKIIKCYLM